MCIDDVLLDFSIWNALTYSIGYSEIDHCVTALDEYTQTTPNYEPQWWCARKIRVLFLLVNSKSLWLSFVITSKLDSIYILCVQNVEWWPFRLFAHSYLTTIDVQAPAERWYGDDVWVSSKRPDSIWKCVEWRSIIQNVGHWSIAWDTDRVWKKEWGRREIKNQTETQSIRKVGVKDNHCTTWQQCQRARHS